MAKLVFALKYVSEDEANDIRALLAENDIDFYETTAGRWQISLAAIWVRNDADYQKARALIHADQQERASVNRNQDKKPTILLGMLAHAKQNPVDFIFVILGVSLLVGLSVAPFVLYFV